MSQEEGKQINEQISEGVESVKQCAAEKLEEMGLKSTPEEKAKENFTDAVKNTLSTDDGSTEAAKGHARAFQSNIEEISKRTGQE